MTKQIWRRKANRLCCKRTRGPLRTLRGAPTTAKYIYIYDKIKPASPSYHHPLQYNQSINQLSHPKIIRPLIIIIFMTIFYLHAYWQYDALCFYMDKVVNPLQGREDGSLTACPPDSFIGDRGGLRVIAMHLVLEGGGLWGPHGLPKT